MKKRKEKIGERRTKRAMGKTVRQAEMKFEGLDLAAALQAIAHCNAGKCQDLDIGIGILREVALKTPPNECRTFLWLSCAHGTHCFREKDALLKYSGAYCNLVHYEMRMDEAVFAYAVEVTGCKNGNPIGNLYALDRLEHCKRIMRAALSAEHVRLTYEHGNRICAVGEFSINDDPQLGKLRRFEMRPKDPDAMQRVLRHEKEIRSLSTPGDFGEYVSGLQKLRDAGF